MTTKDQLKVIRAGFKIIRSDEHNLLIKFKDKSRGVGLEFIWIDEENPPEDTIGWVAKNKKDA